MRAALSAVVSATAYVAIACTPSSGESQSPGSARPAVASPSVSSPSPSSPRVIELPPLPGRGVAAMWSRDDNRVGVTLLTLNGRVLATLQDATLYEPLDPPGFVILEIDSRQQWVLNPSAHELRRISVRRAQNIVGIRGPEFLPSNAFAWWVRAPGGPQVLGQYWRQVGECQEPIAMLRPGSGLGSSPLRVRRSGRRSRRMPSAGPSPVMPSSRSFRDVPVCPARIAMASTRSTSTATLAESGSLLGRTTSRCGAVPQTPRSARSEMDWAACLLLLPADRLR